MGHHLAPQSAFGAYRQRIPLLTDSDELSRLESGKKSLRPFGHGTEAARKRMGDRNIQQILHATTTATISIYMIVCGGSLLLTLSALDDNLGVSTEVCTARSQKRDPA